jgi:DNA invertase Pin-like site-specific DNA recombinase
MRAAIYARVSTERQERQQTIASQVSALRGWAAEAGHVLAEAYVFRDEGCSGSRLDRPGLDGLRDAVRDTAIDIVAVFSPDRLARKVPIRRRPPSFSRLNLSSDLSDVRRSAAKIGVARHGDHHRG